MRTIKEAAIYAKSMNGKPAPGGPGHCQELVRMCYSIPAWATSAKLAFEHLPKDQIHHDLMTAPVGAMIYFPTLSDYGHVIFSLGGGKALSNDYDRRGFCGIAPVDIPNWKGKEHFGGWSLWTPYGVAK